MHFIMSIQNKKQDDITKALNVSHSTVSSWCSGVRMPRMERLKVLADYFDVDPELLTRPHKDLSDFIDDMNKRKESGSSDASKIEYEVEEGNDLTFIKNHFNRMVYYSLYFNAASSGVIPSFFSAVRSRSQRLFFLRCVLRPFLSSCAKAEMLADDTTSAAARSAEVVFLNLIFVILLSLFCE